ncbi:hypothetical protein [Aestuariirhabdus sp. LZHN29]|uniref:hypothetical protein n=1 Tax=Aestuariirhabdus sp. LZHN29 TaxID=3417462 RepID=UPI003CEF6E5E
MKQQTIPRQLCGEKTRQSAVLRQDIERFLARGGRVEVIEPSPLVDLPRRCYPLGPGME